jgi:hypothetical protein
LAGFDSAIVAMRHLLLIIGFPNGPGFRYGNFFIPRAVGPREVRVSFPRANFKVFFNPRDEEISIPKTHGPFGNCIPVRVNQAIFLFKMKYLLHFDKFFDSRAIFYEILQKKNCQIEAV